MDDAPATAAVHKESAAMARVDSVMRAVFFSSELVQLLYFGLEQSETFRTFLGEPCNVEVSCHYSVAKTLVHNDARRRKP